MSVAPTPLDVVVEGEWHQRDAAVATRVERSDDARNDDDNDDSAAAATRVVISTRANTDLWQRSYYGFRNDNAPALLFSRAGNFTFEAHVVAAPCVAQFDQCGVLVRVDASSWAKASVEHEDSRISRLGSVVTNDGYSDWATCDIDTPTLRARNGAIGYRVSRRNADVRFETSLDDGASWQQLRVFHLHALGATTAADGVAQPPREPDATATPPLRFGVYACSPSADARGFDAVFSRLRVTECCWHAHAPATVVAEQAQAQRSSSERCDANE